MYGLSHYSSSEWNFTNRRTSSTEPPLPYSHRCSAKSVQCIQSLWCSSLVTVSGLRCCRTALDCCSLAVKDFFPTSLLQGSPPSAYQVSVCWWYLFPVPFLAPQPCGWAVIIINAQKLIIYYAVYDAIGWQRELSVKKSLNTQQDITASSSAV